MPIEQSNSTKRRRAVRTLIAIATFGVAWPTLHFLNPSTDRVRPFLVALGLAVCSKLFTEYLFGLSMRWFPLMLEPSEKVARTRVAFGVIGLAALMIFMFSTTP